jgi:hypothetical protein
VGEMPVTAMESCSVAPGLKVWRIVPGARMRTPWTQP